MEENDSVRNEMSDFMQSQTEKKLDKNNENCGLKNSTKEALDKSKEDEEDKEKKEQLSDAKKNSKYNTSKYSGMQVNLMKAQSRQLIMILPFLIVGLLILFLMLTRGGDWLRSGIYFSIKKMRGE